MQHFILLYLAEFISLRDNAISVRLALHKKPLSIRARICSNTDRRTPRTTGCSDVFDYGWLEIHLEFSIRIRPVFPYSTWILATDSKCSISHTGHVMVELRYVRFFSQKQWPFMTRTFSNTPCCSRVCDWNTRCTTALLTWTSWNTYVKYALIFENRTLWIRKLCHIFDSQRCLVSSRTDFLQVICTSAKYSQTTRYVFRSVRLKHEIRVKYEKYSYSNTDAHVRFTHVRF